MTQDYTALERFEMVHMTTYVHALPSRTGQWVRYSDHAAAIANLQRERDEARVGRKADERAWFLLVQRRAEAAEAEAADLRARLAAVEGALRAVKNVSRGVSGRIILDAEDEAAIDAALQEPQP